MTIRTILIAGFVCCTMPQAVQAGMPSVGLTEIASLRLQSISFFLMVLLVSAFVFKLLWNLLAKDFPKLPVLSYKGALAGTVLWGLMFLFVLTMISGARELLTPGAWEKTGRTYQLTDSEAEELGTPEELLEARRKQLGELRSALFMHVATHQGKYPKNADDATFAEEFWFQPGDLRVKYGYVIGDKKTAPAEPLAFEQAVYDDDQQLVLFTDGAIKVLPLKEAQEVLNGK
ncbi:hypothetical protein [uncultured Gimesia sp.]|uniref:hypothetical protein n=1 Tax=uncultured Gimesia sp. TaxID=1678688 RepID=UPI0030DACCAE|tara:strand:+ start:121255 stop:121947 length:693 start_codon:yes stop_codon:yes gene_type:complete